MPAPRSHCIVADVDLSKQDGEHVPIWDVIGSVYIISSLSSLKLSKVEYTPLQSVCQWGCLRYYTSWRTLEDGNEPLLGSFHFAIHANKVDTAWLSRESLDSFQPIRSSNGSRTPLYMSHEPLWIKEFSAAWTWKSNRFVSHWNLKGWMSLALNRHVFFPPIICWN